LAGIFGLPEVGCEERYGAGQASGSELQESRISHLARPDAAEDRRVTLNSSLVAIKRTHAQGAHISVNLFLSTYVVTIIRLYMKLSFGICFISLACCALVARPAPDALRILATAPLRFEPVADGGSARFVARGPRYRFEFTPDRAVFHTSAKNLSLRFQGAMKANLEGGDELGSKTNIFLGNDPSHWRKAVPNYRRLSVRGIYPGVDLVYYGNSGELEYDLIVKPGANPRQIRLQLEGGHARLDRDGNLISELIQKRPVAYQTSADGKRIPIESRYRRNSDGSYGFALGPYDHGRELVIDPVLSLAQYIAGSLQDIAYAIGHDSRGLLYVAGTTFSTNLPLGSSQSTPGGGSDLFVTIIDPNAAPYSQIQATSYVGGSGDETFGGMTVGPKGDVYLTGATTSSNFYTVNFPSGSPAQSSLAGANTSDAFVVWMDNFQTIRYSSYLGGAGNDVGRSVAVDSKGRMWVTGSTNSGDFPNVNGMQGYGGQQDMFVAGFDPAQSGSSGLVFSSYLGGTGWDIGRGIAVAGDGTLWVVGGTSSMDINIIGPCFQCTYQGGGDAYIAHLNPALGANALVFATYFGGSNLEEAKDVFIDPAGRIILSGYTMSSSDFPITSNALQPQFGGNTDVFVSIFDPSITPGSAQLVYSTYFGGADADVPFDMKRDANGFLYLSGFTFSSGLPASAQALQASYDGSMDAFALKMDVSKPGASGVNYFSYLGSKGLQIAYGIDFDSSGNIYLAGFTSGPILGSLGGPGKSTNPGNIDAFVVGFNPASR
jgi:hypothetical protein